MSNRTLTNTDNGKITHFVGTTYSQADDNISFTKVYGNVDVEVKANYWEDSATFDDGELAVTVTAQVHSVVESGEQYRDAIRYINLTHRALNELGFEFYKMIEDGVALFHKEATNYP